MEKKKTVIVKDSMGEMEVPEEAYYGASTQRAVLNFPVSGSRVPREIIHAIALIKLAASQANGDLKLLSGEISSSIIRAAEEILEGNLSDQFPVDVYQTGSGTSTNMNVNEVIAARANELLGGNRWERKPVHPNDHVNLGQSSNDVIPASLHIATRMLSGGKLLPALDLLAATFRKKSEEFAKVVKIGRTHWQDAVPITLGQEFSAYTSSISRHREGIAQALEGLEELPLGGTAVGTGLNCHPDFAEKSVEVISRRTGIPFKVARNNFAELGGKDSLTALSRGMSSLASSLCKIASDIRFLSCGPRCGIGELNLPPLQPGSSIMPGKINPVIPESVLQVGARVMGNDVTVSFANASGNLELNVMMPLMGFTIIESISLLMNVCNLFAERCVSGISANEDTCRNLIEQSLAMVTPLALKIGYDRASDVAKEAYRMGKTVREVLLEKKYLTDEEAEEILDPWKMV